MNALHILVTAMLIGFAIVIVIFTYLCIQEARAKRFALAAMCAAMPIIIITVTVFNIITDPYNMVTYCPDQTTMVHDSRHSYCVDPHELQPTLERNEGYWWLP